MSKEVVKKASNQVVPAADMAAWGSDQVISSQDIVIPKILVLQQMSEKVINKEGSFGEMRDTVNNKMFGEIDKPFEFIPLHMSKYWMEFDVNTGKNGQRKRDFKQIVPIVDNPNSPDYNDELPLVEGDVERDRNLDFYVLIPEELAEGGALPYVLNFRRTSLKSGKQLATQMYVRNRAAGKAPAAVTMSLASASKSNDDGTFAVLNVKTSRETTQEEMVEAFNWYKAIQGGQTKVDHSDVIKNEEAPF